MRFRQTWARTGIACAFALGLTAGASAVAAPDYPTRPVSIVVPYAPGGPTDTAARILAQALQEETGATFIVENAPGAGSTLGAGRVARAKPDGYTILWGGKSTHAIAPHLYSTINYDPLTSFEPLGRVATQSYALTVNIDSPFSTVADLVEYGRANPGKLNFSSPGSGSGPHLASELFLIETGLEALHIPYKGGAPAMLAVLSGEVDFTIDTITLPKAQAEGGRARILGVSSAERLTDISDVPTFRESGYDNLVMATWFGLFAPAGTPEDIVKWLNKKMTTVLAQPKVIEQLTTAGFEVEPSSPEEFLEFVKGENERWGNIVKEANVSVI